jgi:hypothetical protein
MKKLICSALLLAALPAHAVIDALDNVPAATLLLPHFDVDLNNANGTRTVFTVGNSSATEVLAHVTLWTDRGVPTINFNLRLDARDMIEIDLRELIVNGALPASTIGGFGASCAGQLPPAALSSSQITGLRNAHTGVASSLLSNQCGGVAYGDGHARGYVTVDSVSSCTQLVPGAAGYFVFGGAGIANNNNVLWGEQSTFNQSTGVAYGDALVHLEASATDPATDGVLAPAQTGPIIIRPAQTIPDYTFYGRRIGGTAADNREGLSQEYMARYSLRGTIDGTRAMVWRDPGVVAPFACGAPPALLSSERIVSFDDQEQLSFTEATAAFGYASQMVNLGDSTQAAVPFMSGFIYYDLRTPIASAPFATLNQAHVSHVLTSSSGNAGQTSGWPINPISLAEFSGQIPVDFSDCSDGRDNDGDGLIDFPADPGCRSADSASESPQCSDGVDNDTDGFIDFPADAGCPAAWMTFENPPCDDGVDNDGDTFIDFPNDPQCTSRADISEEPNTQCSDGIDNDGDGLIDWVPGGGGDPHCGFPGDDLEAQGLCSDGLDNDGDGFIDFPADIGCSSPGDNTETNPHCSDGLDNDGDGFTDFPADRGCSSPTGVTEAPQCNDGLDNDGDGFIDFPADPSCVSANTGVETTQCSDGVDNDFDGFIDFPADPSCAAASSNNESATQCGDGRDNDNDGFIDFPFEPGCTSRDDEFEGPDCSDVFANGGMAIDNDNDGLANFPADPGCESATDQNELFGITTRACSDGVDNDGDLLIDYPADTGCLSANDDVEFTPFEVQGQATAVPTLGELGLLATIALLLFGGMAALRRRRLFGE